MHVPDGFLDAPTSMATGALAAGTVALALRGSHRELDERTAPLAGLTAAFVFAVQMMNFPVGAGTSGHLIGGALTAVLVGPWTAVLCMTVVLLVQAVLFADGGLTALGTNVTLMGLVAVGVGYGVFRLLTAVLPRTRTGVLTAAGVGAFLSVPASALAFVGLFAVGGVADVPLGTVAATMGGIHLLIGLGEAAISVAVLGAVLAVRPDLVRGAAALRRPADLARRSAPAGAGAR
ncbi:energy-coupling factor ABC transporter permease [Geodermatophilus sabuli]|uniref:energy-coupling factor ABC transporter permease n=1 Tax=Geodermatophilus sabuli TaxID=1564158 RepID=UPI0031F2EFEE